MKNIVMIIISAILGALTLLMVMSIEGRNSRNMELKMNFSSAAEKTVEILMSDPKYSMENVDQFVADFTQSMAAAFDSNAAVVVEVMNADREKGLLSLKITGEFTHPNGRKGTVQDERTVIFRQNPEGEEKHYTVSFYVSDASGQSECYKLYEIEEGAIATEPSRPMQEGKTFAGWVDGNGYLADFSVPVTQNLVYYASWN